MKVKKILTGVVIFLFVVVAGLLIFVNNFAEKGLPDYNQSISIPGLEKTVTIYRDKYAVPHIYAENENDLYLATGYVMAQDRMWQMDLIRRVTMGRLSEIFGEKMIKADMLFRTLSIPQKSKLVLDKASDKMMNHLNAYAEGVNYYIKEHKGNFPLEFNVLGYAPDNWEPLHTLNLIGYMAWDLAGGWNTEIVISNLEKKLGTDLIEEITPEYNKHSPTFPDYVKAELIDKLYKDFVLRKDTISHLGVQVFNASNNWAVSGIKSTTGKPVLANDMHLGLNSPGIWFQMHQNIKGKLNVTGVALPGAPIVVCGHNDNIAWGMTNVMVDNLDFYIEKINPDNPDEYFYMGEWKKIRTKKEIIKIKGGTQKEFEVRYTVHGPIVSELKKDITEMVISAKWQGFEYSNEILGLYQFNYAENFEDFKVAASKFISVSQNIVYADTKGNIGLVCAAGIPIRPSNDGTKVQPGWTGEHEWQGIVPFDELPISYNPAEGFVSSANYNTAKNFPYYINKWGFFGPYRLNRINEILKSKDKFSVQDIKEMQLDMRSKFSELLINGIIAATEQNTDLTKLEKEALAILKTWDLSMDAESSAAAIFKSFQICFMENTFKDQMGEDLYKGYIKNKSLVGFVVEQLWNTESSWFDNVNTDNKETFSDIVQKSFSDSIAKLEKEFGSSINTWEWGKMHTFTLQHPLGSVKILDTIFKLNKGPYELGGSLNTIPAYGYTFLKPFKVNYGPSQRHVYDLSQWDKSFSVIPTGNSGIPASKYYCDQTDLYVNGKFHVDYVSKALIQKNAEYTMVLESAR
ncbi:MAG: penicillin acylase family protein [Desulfobacteraceae bacterium]|nr:penicillin acylase family protein [Desulfobacteraceae bacterium]